MNENNPTVETLLQAIPAEREWPRKILIGSLLGFIPVVNLLCLGYLYRYVSQIRRKQDCKLPEWNNWDRLFINGLKVFVILLLYGLIPWLLAWALSIILLVVSFGLLGFIAWTPMALVSLVAPALSACALYMFQGSRGDWKVLFEVPAIFQLAWRNAAYLIIPTLLLIGFSTLTAPLWGVAFFVGPLVFFGYTSLLLTRRIQRERAL